ncbi:Hypothetical Protein PAU_00785 [Photorhabdus asymbiotica]|uniref:DUF1240 domain-containing protein n=3 Tax=Morganellaceae TaxID=1903414 RepID=B6VMH9_PHOAA|nr:uncharacterized protein DUF1240 [Photorhabdus asymbiotica]CAQ82877.1 Hypothetical Protein PAU_00785 [Photorhabdus asymbiotica]CAR67359.1 Hypothetical Protein PA-RVA13-1230 [Photorhabdus asymbiotica subsp. asymbiotica ATCC 43949]
MLSLIFMSISIFGGISSIIDYKEFLTRSDIITFSSKSSWFISFSPLSMYFSLKFIKFTIVNHKVAFNNKIGSIFTFIGMIGFIFTLFFSFYVEFKLKDENYFTCAKSSWIAPNKYVKDISLCKQA